MGRESVLNDSLDFSNVLQTAKDIQDKVHAATPKAAVEEPQRPKRKISISSAPTGSANVASSEGRAQGAAEHLALDDVLGRAHNIACQIYGEENMEKCMKKGPIGRGRRRSSFKDELEPNNIVSRAWNIRSRLIPKSTEEQEPKSEEGNAQQSPPPPTISIEGGVPRRFREQPLDYQKIYKGAFDIQRKARPSERNIASASEAAANSAIARGYPPADVAAIAAKAAKVAGGTRAAVANAAGNAASKAAMAARMPPAAVGQTAAQAARTAGASQQQAAQAAGKAAGDAAFASGMAPAQASEVAFAAAKAQGASPSDAAKAAGRAAGRSAVAAGYSPEQAASLAANAVRASGGSPTLAAQAAAESAADAAIARGVPAAEVGKIAGNAAKEAGASPADVALASSDAAGKAATRADMDPSEVAGIAADAAKAAGANPEECARAAGDAASKAAVAQGMVPADVAKAATQATKAAGGSAALVATEAGNAAAAAAIAHGATPSEVGAIAARAAKDAGATPADIAKVAAAGARDASIAENASPAEVARQAVDAANAVGCSNTLVAKVASEAAGKAARVNGQSPVETSQSVAQATASLGSAHPAVAAKHGHSEATRARYDNGHQRNVFETASDHASHLSPAELESLRVAKAQANEVTTEAISQGKSPQAAGRAAAHAFEKQGHTHESAQAAAAAAATATVVQRGSPAEAGKQALLAARNELPPTDHHVEEADAAAIKAAAEVIGKTCIDSGMPPAEVAHAVADAVFGAEGTPAEASTAAGNAAYEAALAAHMSPDDALKAAADAQVSIPGSPAAAGDAACRGAIESRKSLQDVERITRDAVKASGGTDADAERVAHRARLQAANSTASQATLPVVGSPPLTSGIRYAPSTASQAVVGAYPSAGSQLVVGAYSSSQPARPSTSRGFATTKARGLAPTDSQRTVKTVTSQSASQLPSQANPTASAFQQFASARARAPEKLETARPREQRYSQPPTLSSSSQAPAPALPKQLVQSAPVRKVGLQAQTFPVQSLPLQALSPGRVAPMDPVASPTNRVDSLSASRQSVNLLPVQRPSVGSLQSFSPRALATRTVSYSHQPTSPVFSPQQPRLPSMPPGSPQARVYSQPATTSYYAPRSPVASQRSSRAPSFSAPAYPLRSPVAQVPVVAGPGTVTPSARGLSGAQTPNGLTFEAVDRNHDGVISREELEAALSRATFAQQSPFAWPTVPATSQ